MKNVSPRTGRPKSENPKSVDIKVRLDEATHDKLLAYCKENGVTKAEAIRAGIDLLLKK